MLLSNIQSNLWYLYMWRFGNLVQRNSCTIGLLGCALKVWHDFDIKISLKSKGICTKPNPTFLRPIKFSDQFWIICCNLYWSAGNGMFDFFIFIDVWYLLLLNISLCRWYIVYLKSLFNSKCHYSSQLGKIFIKLKENFVSISLVFFQ